MRYKHRWSQPETMEGCSNGLNIADDSDEVTIFKVLGVDLCAQAILDLVPVKDLVRSQRVCRWLQGVVHHYLRRCRTLSFHYVADDWTPSYATKTSTHRRIDMSPKDHHLLLACKVVDKWGPSIVELNAAEDWHEEYDKKQYKHFLDVITSKCINLQKIKMFVTDEKDLNRIKNLKNLRHVFLQYFNVYENKNTDHLLGEIFQNLDCETIFIDFNVHLTGSFLNSINPINLRSLHFINCSHLNISNMLTAVCLRNITTLHLDENFTLVIAQVHLLFKEMPQLEELSLRGYNLEFDGTPIVEVSFESFSELVNLRRLYMENTKYVNDALLEALARGSKKLECLDVRGSAGSITVDGLAALCRRAPAARTTLHFGVPADEQDDLQLEIYFRRHFEDIDLFEDLEVLGCVEMTQEWFSAAARDPRGRELLLNPGAVQADDPQELKIILFDDTFEYFPPLE